MTKRLVALCVDDDADTLFVTCLSLELDVSIKTIQSHSATETIQIIEKGAQDISCILLDVRMPDMSGPDLMNRIRQIQGEKATPVIFLTASVRDIDAEGYKALGALGMIRKPFDPLSLASDVRRLLEQA